MLKKTFISLLLVGIFCFIALPVFAEEATGEAAKMEAAPAEKAAQPAAEEKAMPEAPKYKASVVKAIQEALKADGSYSGEATGKLDDATTEAIKKFQEKKGLKADGIPGAKTREAMGIGAAPAPKEEAAPAKEPEKKEETKPEKSEEKKE